MKFDSKETEEYFYEQAKKHRLIYVNADKYMIWTMEDVEIIVKSMEEF